MNRSESRGRQLAAEMNCTFVKWQSWDQLRVDIVVNATTVGMSTTRDQSLVPLYWLEKTMVILDMVYLPLQTKLITDGQQAGCVCVNGLDMLLYQGVAQFEVWTGRVAPIEVMRKALMAAARAYDLP
jgi:shikimate dehydrogenase